MMRLIIAMARVAIAALFLFSPIAMVHAQTIDPTADREAVGKVMHEYFEAYVTLRPKMSMMRPSGSG